VRISASVARLRSSFDIAKKTDSQLITSADRGGDGGDDGIDRESMEFEEDKGVCILVDEINFRSVCSRRLLKRKKREHFLILLVCLINIKFYLKKRREKKRLEIYDL
jgi:hypothetical protein